MRYDYYTIGVPGDCADSVEELGSIAIDEARRLTITTLHTEGAPMTVATKKTVLADFSVEFLGVDYSDYFQGFGLGPSSKYEACTYGIGDTEEEALNDCMEMMAQNADFDFTEEVEKRIRAAYGDCDADTTVADYLGHEDSDEEEDSDDCGESAWFHVGIKWNEKEVAD